MSKPVPWYLTQRAEALALVYLTRRDDLIVRQQTHDDTGIDYIIEIVNDGRSTGRIFGLQLKARTTALQGSALNKTIGITYEQWMVELPFPLCLFVFIMETNEGYYKWLSEPFVTGDQKPKLCLNAEGSLEKLSDDQLEHIVSCVNKWYDALSANLTS
jgi:hypothetical protein